MNDEGSKDTKDAKTKPVTIRLAPEIIGRLDEFIESYGFGKRSSVVRLCVNSFLDEFERSGMDSLPADWKQIMKELDNRTHRYKSRNTDSKNGNSQSSENETGEHEKEA